MMPLAITSRNQNLKLMIEVIEFSCLIIGQEQHIFSLKEKVYFSKIEDFDLKTRLTQRSDQKHMADH